MEYKLSLRHLHRKCRLLQQGHRPTIERNQSVEMGPSPTVRYAGIPVACDYVTSDLVPPFADPHGTLQLAVQILNGLGPWPAALRQAGWRRW